MGFLDDAWNGITTQASRLGNYLGHTGISGPGFSYQPKRNWEDGADMWGNYPQKQPPQPQAYTQPAAASSPQWLNTTKGIQGAAAIPTTTTQAWDPSQVTVNGTPVDAWNAGQRPAAVQTTAASPAAPAPQRQPVGGQYDGEIARLAREAEGRQTALMGQYQSLSQPYDVNGQGFRDQLGVNRDAISRNFSGAAGRIQAQAGARGGGASVGGALSRAMVDQARAQSDASRGLYADYADKAAQWDLSRLAGEAAVGRGDYSGAQEAYNSLAARAQQQGQYTDTMGYNRERAAADDAYRSGESQHRSEQDQVQNAQEQQRIDILKQQYQQAVESGDKATAASAGAALASLGVRVYEAYQQGQQGGQQNPGHAAPTGDMPGGYIAPPLSIGF